MAARAMWKGVIRFEKIAVPVKLYAAIEDRAVHFRLLHVTDHAPVKQALVNPLNDTVVPYGDARRAFATDEGDMVLLQPDELAATEPEPSRDIRVLCFLPASAIDHRWYLRPYYLGPDEGAGPAYAALIAALADTAREGLARWTMRKKAYVGALRLHGGYPVLIALRHSEEVVPLEELTPPSGPPLDKREIGMAEQLLEMLAADFEPDQYHDEYRARVCELIDKKSRGERIRIAPPAPPPPSPDLTAALEASLRRERRSA